MNQPKQLPITFHTQTAYHPEDFIISPSNEAAHAMITAWPDWPAHCLILHGPTGSGKTHLAHCWQHAPQAVFTTPAEAPPYTPCIIDACEQYLPEAQEALLHCYNTTKEQGIHLLLLTTTAPQNLPITLPDLASRLKSTPAIALEAPDDTLLKAVLIKAAADRQLHLSGDVLAFLTKRMERSFDAIHSLIDALDHESLAAQRHITIPLAKTVLEKL